MQLSSLFRRLSLGLHLCAVAGAAVGLSAHAQGVPTSCAITGQTYPTKPIKLVVGFPAGGSSDQIGRYLADAMSARLGQPVLVDNRPGAGSSIAATQVAKSPADGYTLLLATMGTHAINPFLYSKLSYEPAKDFVPIAYAINAANVFLARADSPVKTMEDFIAAARSKVRPINVALPGNGTSPHLASALFEAFAQASVSSIMYRGNAPALTDILGGQVEFMVDTVTTSAPLVERGTLRALAVTSPTRSPMLPNVPTVAEILPGYEVNPWWGVAAPRGTPKEVTERLHCEINQALVDPQVVSRFKALGAVAQPMSMDEFSQLIARDAAKWEQIIRKANIKPD